MENLSIEVGQVRHDEDEDGFYDSDLICVSSDEACQEAPQDANDGATKRHHKEWSKSRREVYIQNVAGTHLRVGLEHMIQHLQQKIGFHYIS